MAKQLFEFSGKAAWLGRQPNKWGKFTFNLYPSAADRKAIKETGIKNKVQEDDGSKSGIEGLFYTLRSNVLFPIQYASGEDIDAMIGNGSEVRVQLLVETFDSKEHGPQARSSVEKVIVTKFIPYEKQPETAEVPAE